MVKYMIMTLQILQSELLLLSCENQEIGLARL